MTKGKSSAKLNWRLAIFLLAIRGTAAEMNYASRGAKYSSQMPIGKKEPENKQE